MVSRSGVRGRPCRTTLRRPPPLAYRPVSNRPLPVQATRETVRGEPGRCTHRTVSNHIPGCGNHPRPISVRGEPPRSPSEGRVEPQSPGNQPTRLPPPSSHRPLRSHSSPLSPLPSPLPLMVSRARVRRRPVSNHPSASASLTFVGAASATRPSFTERRWCQLAS